MRHRRTRGDDDDLGIGIFCLDQAVQPLDCVLAGPFHCSPDFLLPGGVGGIADVVALHDKRIAHHPDRRTFHVHAGHGGAVRVIGRKTHVGRGEIDDVLGVRYEESVAAQRQGKVHIRLFRHHVAFEDPIEEVLCGFRMPDDHAGIQKIRNLECVRLNRQWGVDAAAGDDHLNRQPCAGPHGEVLHRTHRAGSCGRRKHASSAKGRSRALRHDGEFALAAEVVADVPLGKELADQGSRFALRCNRIRDHDVTAGPPERFLDDLAARKE